MPSYFEYLKRKPDRAVLVGGAVLALILAALPVFEGIEGWERTQRDADRTVTNLALVVEQEVASTLRTIDVSLKTVAELIELSPARQLDAPAVGMAMKGRLKDPPFVRSIAIFDADGRTVQNTAGIPVASAITAADRDYFAVHRDDPARGLVLGTPISGRETQQLTVPMGRRIGGPDGRFAGAVVAFVDPRAMSEVYGDVDVGAGGAISLIRADGTILTRFPYREDIVGRSLRDAPLFREHLPRSRVGLVTGTRTVENAKRLYSYRALADFPVVVYVGIDQDRVLRQKLIGAAVHFGIAVAILVIVGFATILLIRAMQRQQSLLEQTRASEDRYRILFDDLPVGISESTADGRIILVNTAWRRMYGYGETDAVAGIDASKFWADSSDRARMFDQLAGKDHAAKAEALRKRRDGTKFWVELNTHGTVDADGKLQRMRSIHIDIADRKRREEIESAHRAAEVEFRALFNDLPVGISDTTSDGRILAVNAAWRRMYGYGETDELAEVRLPEHWVDPSARVRWIEGLLQKDHVGKLEVLRKRRDGTRFWVELHARGVVDADGKLQRLRTIHLDVTDRKQREEVEAARREIEDRLHLAVRAGNVGLWDWNLRTNKVYFSPEWKRQIGYEDHEISGDFSEWETRLHPDDRARAVRTAQAFIEKPEGYYNVEFRLCHKNGSYRWIVAHGAVLQDDQGKPIRMLGSHFDVTERKRMEAELRETAAAERAGEMNYRTLIAASAAAIVGLDTSGNVTLWNPAAETLFGYSVAEVLGKPLPTVPEDQQDKFERGLDLLTRGQTILDEQRVRRTKDGRLITISVRVAPVYGSDGRLIGSIAVVTDLTERMALENQLHQAQKMEAVGQLTGGIAHDFNNLLTVILGNAETLAEALADNPKLKRLAEMTGMAAQRGADLTKSLLMYSRRQKLEPRVTDINGLVKRMEKLLRRALGEQVEIALVRGSGAGSATVDPAQLEAAILNLAVNARDAMPRGGKLTIETADVELDRDYARANEGAKPGSYVVIAVSDTGTGMPPEVVAKAFDPFFTTKEVGKGTGLGLSMVYGFVKQSGGYIKLYSEVGHGTTVKLYLPRATLADKPDAAASGAAEIRGDNETILLVEDDELVRAHVEGLVKGLGYSVLSARNGPEALDILRQDRKIDLLFTDIVMPGGMTGLQLAEEARRLRPGLRVLYTSGYAEGAMAGQGTQDIGFDLLSKPYQRHKLAAKLRQALEAKGPAA
jgi:PAS domain S-box-containing protein